MMFEAMAFKFCPLHIKLSTSNFKKGLSSCDKPFFVVRGSWFVVRGGRPKGRPAVIFDHSPLWYYGKPFRCYYADAIGLRATNH